MEQLTLNKEVVVESVAIVGNHLLDHRQLRTAGLKDDQTTVATAPSTPTHLAHHHESMLVSAEIRIVEHRVGVEDAHHTHPAEVEALRHHLRTNEHIGLAHGEIGDEPLVGVARMGGVEVHACHPCLGEDVAYLVLNVLGAIATTTDVRVLAIGTDGGHGIGGATVMARQEVETLVERERHVAVLTLGHPPTHPTLEHGRKAATVLEEDNLTTGGERIAHGCQKRGRERAAHHLAMA